MSEPLRCTCKRWPFDEDVASVLLCPYHGIYTTVPKPKPEPESLAPVDGEET